MSNIKTTHDLILQQIMLLRECHSIARIDREAYANAKNAHERMKAEASLQVALGVAHDADGNELKLSNDITRKAYIESKSLDAQCEMNLALANRDSSVEKVDLEKSVLSALKEVFNDESFSLDVLDKYEIFTT